MALMYPWATKEYLLWNMSLGQIVMYLAIGSEQKHGKQENKPTYQGKSYEELKQIREELRAQQTHTQREPELEAMRGRYGAVDG
jgi:hypothetical protein